jgi:signal peptidase I
MAHIAARTRLSRLAWLASTARRAFSALATAGVCGFAAAAVAAAVAAHFSPGGGATIFGRPVMTVLSGSMSPAIRTGDLIVDSPVSPVSARQLRAGQIASFRAAPGSRLVITHRITGVVVRHGTVRYRTEGDANSAPDAQLRPAGQVVGVLRWVVPHGGLVLAALHRPLVAGLLLASAALWFLAGPLYRLARGK